MTASWGWPQYVMAGLFTFIVFMAPIVNGTPKTGTHDGAWTIIFIAVEAWILYMGGFWS